MIVPTTAAVPMGAPAFPSSNRCESAERYVSDVATDGSWFTATAKLADPRLWGGESFFSVSVNATVAPAPTPADGATVAAYGFLVVAAVETAGTATDAATTQAMNKKSWLNGEGVRLRIEPPLLTDIL